MNINFLKNKLIFGKYKILKLIDKGSFGEVYLGLNTINKKLFAIKIENRFTQRPLLETEVFILYNIKGPGIPSVISYGHCGKYNILVQSLLGKSLEKIWKKNNNKLNLKDTCMIAIQTLDRIEYIHSKNYLHRDIKPANFLVGYPDNSQIYIIDFGNSRKFRSSRTGKHIQSFKINKIFGTTLFLSLNVLRGNEQSRKDDLESLGYMYIFLHTGELPWSKVKAGDINKILYETTELKEKTTIEEICKNMPNEMCLYLKYVRNLIFDEKPDYNYLRNLFKNILIKMGEKNDNLFSWVDKNKILPNFKNKKYSRSNPQIRLLRKIIESSSKKLTPPASSFINLPKNIKLTNSEKNEKINVKIIKSVSENNKNIIYDENINNDNNNKNISNYSKIPLYSNINSNYNTDNSEQLVYNEKIKKIFLNKKKSLKIAKNNPKNNIKNKNKVNTINNPTIIININKPNYKNIENSHKSNRNIHSINFYNINDELVNDINYKKKTIFYVNQQKNRLNTNSLPFNDNNNKNFLYNNKTNINKMKLFNNQNHNYYSSLQIDKQITDINYRRIIDRINISNNNKKIYINNNIMYLKPKNELREKSQSNSNDKFKYLNIIKNVNKNNNLDINNYRKKYINIYSLISEDIINNNTEIFNKRRNRNKLRYSTNKELYNKHNTLNIPNFLPISRIDNYNTLNINENNCSYYNSRTHLYIQNFDK